MQAMVAPPWWSILPRNDAVRWPWWSTLRVVDLSAVLSSMGNAVASDAEQLVASKNAARMVERVVAERMPANGGAVLSFVDIVVHLCHNFQAIADGSTSDHEWSAAGSFGFRGWAAVTEMMTSLCAVNKLTRRLMLDALRHKVYRPARLDLARRISQFHRTLTQFHCSSHLIPFVEARVAPHVISRMVGLLRIEWITRAEQITGSARVITARSARVIHSMPCGTDPRSIALAAVIEGITELVPGAPGTTHMLREVARFCPSLRSLDLQVFGGNSAEDSWPPVGNLATVDELERRVAALAEITLSLGQVSERFGLGLEELDMHTFLRQPFTLTAVAHLKRKCADSTRTAHAPLSNASHPLLLFSPSLVSFGSCSTLTALSLESCEAGDDATMQLLHTGLPKLTYLNLSWAGRVRSSQMKNLVKARVSLGLEVLGLQGTRLTQGTAEFLLEEYPKLEIDKNMAGQSSEESGEPQVFVDGDTLDVSSDEVEENE